MTDEDKKIITIVQILALVVLRDLLLIYYFYLNKSSGVNFWRLVSGGIEVKKSKYILYAAMYTLPDFLFYYYICSKYIAQLKQNYVYIFIREKNIKKWLRKFTFVSFLDILLYELVAAGILFLMATGLNEKTIIKSDELIVMLICQIIKLVIIVIFCDILLVRFNEMAAIYVNLMVLVMPVFLTGVLYDINGAWKAAIKYIPVNWCNYNYMMEAGINPSVMLWLSFVLVVVMYLYLEKLFKDYEAI